MQASMRQVHKSHRVDDQAVGCNVLFPPRMVLLFQLRRLSKAFHARAVRHTSGLGAAHHTFGQ